MDVFHKNVMDLIESIEDCLRKEHRLSSLVLLYSGTDVIASLDRRAGESPKHSFIRWVNGYLLKARSLPCNALDLYAARCGILHAFTAASDLSGKGQARQVHYAWGTADPDDHAAASKIVRRNDCVCVRIRDLVDGFRVGVAAYFADIEKDPAQRLRFQNGVGLWFTEMDQESIKELLHMHAKSRRGDSRVLRRQHPDDRATAQGEALSRSHGSG